MIKELSKSTFHQAKLKPKPIFDLTLNLNLLKFQIMNFNFID